MQISVSRSGGYAGLTEELATVDTASLPSDAGQALEALVRQAGVFAENVERLETAVGADMYRYRVTVVDQGRQTTVNFSDDGGPTTAALRNLVEQVTRSRD